MASFDIVNKLDMQEVDNAVNNTIKTIDTRYDFRGSNTRIELNKKEKKVEIVTADEIKMKAVQEMFISNFIKRKIDPKCLDFGIIDSTSGGQKKMTITLLEGIDKEKAKKIVKIIKEKKLKVQAAIMDESVRVTGKKIDDLQSVIQTLKEEKSLGIPLQFVNMK